MALDPSSRNRLTPQLAARFGGATLFDKVARTLCSAGVLPRKELYESWEVARRACRRLHGERVVDLCAGHGLVPYLMLLLDSDLRSGVSVDVRQPKSASAIAAAMCREWPQLDGRVRFAVAPLESVAVQATDVVVSVHACGALTDQVLGLATRARAPVAVLPCCHENSAGVAGTLAGMLAGWLDLPLCVDVGRVASLAAAGYRVWTQRIDAAITEKNRLILARPAAL